MKVDTQQAQKPERRGVGTNQDVLTIVDKQWFAAAGTSGQRNRTGTPTQSSRRFIQGDPRALLGGCDGSGESCPSTAHNGNSPRLSKPHGIAPSA